ncbi:hypothetical protein OBBRIDRAFT_787680 [Obba rivulosa]|uniref:Uncharacterized protein n=1 Tax=Obba rivulosa TaxID=1052685 RepID=A0A8E2DUD4_9APHY|nr:hypothetical protein OBBRIDRAFT_787680 [Obba rivulosa]
MSQKIIRRPPTSRGSLQKLMKLSNNGPQFKQFTKHMRRIAGKLLDVSVRYAEQDPLILEDFRVAAATSYPYMKNYEDAWPVLFYIRTYLAAVWKRHRYLKNELERHGRRQSMTPNYAETLEDSDEEQSEVRSHLDKEELPTLPPLSNSLSTSQPLRSKLLPQANADGDKSPWSSKGALGSHATSESSSTSSSATTSAPAPSSVRCLTPSSGETRVSTFSALISQKLMHLKEKLSGAGLTTEAKFRTMLEWPVSERLAFLRDDAHLSAFESREVNTILVYMSG